MHASRIRLSGTGLAKLVVREAARLVYFSGQELAGNARGGEGWEHRLVAYRKRDVAAT